MQRFTTDTLKPRQIQQQHRHLQQAVKLADPSHNSLLTTATLTAVIQRTVSLGTYPQPVKNPR